MARSLFFLIVALASALPAQATDLGFVKCGPNQDRVWVYVALNNFDVQARLKCGESVEILSRVKGYVKIRTASGDEGYVPDATFPDLPPLPDDSDKPAAASLAASIAARAAASRAASLPAVTPASAVSTAAAPTPTAVAPPAAVSPAPVSIATTVPSAAPQPTVAIAQPAPAPVAAKVYAPVKITPVVPAVAMDTKAVSALVAAPKPHRVSTSEPTFVVEPPAPKKALVKPAPSTVQTARTVDISPATQSSPAVASVVPVADSMPPVSAKLMAMSSHATPTADISIAVTAASEAESEDYPESKPENESADPACHMFFSAYGLAPAQYKWLVENRRKDYSGICPAPDLNHVDYVILFAHDSDSYTDAMPAQVHTDRNGFSDFNPVSTIDTALMSESALDKARYEFVWVFHTKRGTFDPSRFSARRRPQFTTDAKGSHASSRAVEDAFQFIQGQGTPDR